MRKITSKLKRLVKKTFIVAIVMVALWLAHLISIIPEQVYYWFGAASFVVFFFWIVFKRKPEKYINEDGYVVLSQLGELEHRYIAKQIIGRDLEKNEVVHHINGRRTDNTIRNLCVMDREKHEHFHSWLSWKKKKSGKYPSFGEQDRVLVEEYGGTLLKNYASPDKNIVQQKSEEMVFNGHEKSENNVSDEKTLDFSKVLFNELRKERKRLADEKKLPAYMIFDDKALHEMVELLPDSETMLLKVRGVGPTKLQMYGAHFIAVIKKNKAEFGIKPRNKIDSA